MLWKIYYGDGSTYDDLNGDAYDAPARDVQIIILFDKQHNWKAQSGADYYVYVDQTWKGVDMFGLFDYLIDPGHKKVLFGRTISNEEYSKIVTKATQEADFPFKQKTAYRRGERRP